MKQVTLLVRNVWLTGIFISLTVPKAINKCSLKCRRGTSCGLSRTVFISYFVFCVNLDLIRLGSIEITTIFAVSCKEIQI